MKRNARIPALRNIEFAVDIPMISSENAGREVKNLAEASMKRPWTIANELNQLMGKLLAEDAQSAMKFRDSWRPESSTKPPETNLIKMRAFWKRRFPGREIDLTSYRPTAKSKLGNRQEAYPIQHMSDGERVALYLAARVIDAPPGPIIVDEPEVHFHSLLARQVWDDLEDLREDCRFIYLTHDLSFALSRKSSQFGIVKSEESVEFFAHKAGIPRDVFERILGAASFSVFAKRLVFCEGEAGGTDHQVYSAWFSDDDTEVFPVGGCANVIDCVSVFRSGQATINVDAVGIIDRDYWPGKFIDRQTNAGVHVLQVHEIESLLCISDVFNAVSKHHGKDNDVSAAGYGAFLQRAQANLTGANLNKQILERVKRRITLIAEGSINGVSPDEDLDAVRASFNKALASDRWEPHPSQVFAEEEATVVSALEGEADEFLRVVPGKSCLGPLLQELGFGTKVDLVDLVCTALRSKDSEGNAGITGLRDDLVDALSPFLPPRTHTVEVPPAAVEIPDVEPT